MTRKKAPTNKHQYVPLEERPEFLAVLAALPAASEVEALQQLAADSLALFNDAVRGNAPEQAALAILRYDAVVYRLHGDSFFGCATDDGSYVRLERQLAAVPGTVPGWGQGGEWLVEVNGMRIRAKVGHGPKGTIPLDLWAVDLDLPFLSPTGYRSHWIHYDQWLGRELSAAVRAELERCLQEKDWQPVVIADKDKQWLDDIPAWLAPALEGVTRNGQHALPLSGRAPVELPAPIEAEPKAPMSNADRQREFRRRQKELRENQGLRAISLTSTERCVLSLGLLAHEDLDHRGPNWVNDKKPGFDALLQKLWPEGDKGRYLAEPKRSTYRPTAFLRGRLDEAERRIKRMDEIHQSERDELFALRKENAELKAGLQEIAAEFAGTGKPARPAADVTALQAEVGVLTEEITQLRKALDVEKRERALMLDERNSGHAAVVEALRGEIVSLRARLDKQHADNLFTIAEQGKAATAVSRLQRRLEAAGLPNDYRALPGEW